MSCYSMYSTLHIDIDSSRYWTQEAPLSAWALFHIIPCHRYRTQQVPSSAWAPTSLSMPACLGRNFQDCWCWRCSCWRRLAFRRNFDGIGCRGCGGCCGGGGCCWAAREADVDPFRIRIWFSLVGSICSGSSLMPFFAKYAFSTLSELFVFLTVFGFFPERNQFLNALWIGYGIDQNSSSLTAS